MDESLTLFDMKKNRGMLGIFMFVSLRLSSWASRGLIWVQGATAPAAAEFICVLTTKFCKWLSRLIENVSFIYWSNYQMSESNTKRSCSLWGIPNFPDSGFVMKIEWRFITLNFAFKNMFAARNSALSYPCTFMSSISVVLLQRMSVCKAKNVSPASYKILPWKADCTESY